MLSAESDMHDGHAYSRYAPKGWTACGHVLRLLSIEWQHNNRQLLVSKAIKHRVTQSGSVNVRRGKRDGVGQGG